MCRRAKRQVLDKEWQRTSSMLPIVDVAYHRGREVGERRAHDGVRVTIVRCGQGRVRWTDDVLLAVHFEIGLYCAANYEHSLNLCLH
jgi:hypothetical protein